MADPNVYPGTNVLKNFQNIKDKDVLQDFETKKTRSRIEELRKNPEVVKGNQDYPHLQAIHKHIFQDVYPFAGKERTINMGKAEPLLQGETAHYTPVQNISSYAEKNLNKLNNIDFSKNKNDAFKQYAEAITEAWTAHAFREGNTRTISAFMEQNLATKGVPIDMVSLNKNMALRDAFILSYGGNEKPLVNALTSAHKAKTISTAKESLKMDNSPENKAAIVKELLSNNIKPKDISPAPNKAIERKDGKGYSR